MTAERFALDKDHPCWPEFVVRLADHLDTCRHDHRHTVRALLAMEADVGRSILYLRSKGGYCDCEVMLNVVHGDEA